MNLDLDIPDLPAALARLLRQIPKGCVTTYGDLARALGSASAARWVGEYMVDHRHTPRCPCHRVVRADGGIGLYVTRDFSWKRSRLAAEGVECDLSGARVDLARHRFAEFDCDQPLERLAEFQRQIPSQVKPRPLRRVPAQVGGVDVAYISRGEAAAAYVLVDSKSGELLWSHRITRPVEFPYIPGFLTFRELPILLELLAEVESHGRLARLLFVDGNGLLHPRRAGIATVLGVLANLATVGVAKSLLCGQVRPVAGKRSGGHSESAVRVDGEIRGLAVAVPGRSRTIYVSPGQSIDIPGAGLAARQLFHGHRLPEPIYQADRLSRRE